MKRTLVVLLGAASLAWLTGCIPVTYTKTVIVHKDANGNITGTDTIESVTEPHSETPRITAKPNPMTFDHLK